MSKYVLPFAALMAVAACDGPAIVSGSGGSGGATDGGSDGTDAVVPDALKVNLESIAYDGTTLEVKISALDSTPASVTYARDTRLDIGGYKAFKVQEDALDRLFVALAGTSDDGSVTAVTVGDGGQFNTYYAGGLYHREGTFDRPTIGTGPGAGQVSYAGNYVAVTNVAAPRDGGADDVALPITATGENSVVPSQPSRVEGEIFLNANFADNTVNGSIYNRVLVDYAMPLADVILVPADIATDGTFFGAAQNADQGVIGDYGGIFGGTDAQSVAGVVHLTEFEATLENEQEHGIFVLTQCGPDNTLPICGDVAP